MFRAVANGNGLTSEAFNVQGLFGSFWKIRGWNSGAEHGLGALL